MLTETELKWVKETRHLCNRCEWNLYDNPCVRYGRLGMGEMCPECGHTGTLKVFKVGFDSVSLPQAKQGEKDAQ